MKKTYNIKVTISQTTPGLAFRDQIDFDFGDDITEGRHFSQMADEALERCGHPYTIALYEVVDYNEE